MPEYLSPGVYIEEVNKGPRPIEAVATSVAAFVGFAPYSRYEDANRPVLITSWTQYVDKFGLREDDGRKQAFMKDAYLSHAVYGFFQNGGTRCYVTRVVPRGSMDTAPKQISIPQQIAKKGKETPKSILNVSAQSKPSEPLKQDIEISIVRAPGTDPAQNLVNMRVQKGDEVEEYTNVSFAQKAATASSASSKKGDQAAAADGQSTPAPDLAVPKSKVMTLDDVNKSKLVQIALVSGVVVDAAALIGIHYISVPQPETTALATLQSGDIAGDVTERSGVVGLEIAEDVTMVCCPDLMSPLAYAEGKVDLGRVKAVQTAMISHCELSADRLAILDAPRGFDPQRVAKWRINSTDDDAGYDSMFAALYYPWVTIDNPLAGKDGEPKQIEVPPCGHIAGIYARSDTERGVHKAPANEIVRGALKLEREITKGEQDGLNPNGINCIRTFPGRGIRVWGARTLTSDPAWRYINVRRLFNMVERSIERDTQWVVFEPNDPDLWSRVRRDVGAFLTGLWRDGMLFGNTPEQAFYVKCDEELNPPASRDLGRLIIEVGMAPVKPAEFVIFRFSQYTAEAA